jgi:protein-disulfide isomerase
MKNPWVIVGIIAVVLFGGSIWFSNQAGEKSNEGVTPTVHVKGNPDATVTLVEYSDFQCPACAAFQPVVKQLMEMYGDKLRFEYHHFPLPIHPFAQQAALAAEAAGQQGKFFEMHDKLFENQQEWSSSRTPQVFFIKYAEELGLNVETFKAQQKASVLREAVKADMNRAQDELKLTGTPSFFLNGEKMEYETFEDFMAQITAAIDPDAAALLENALNATSTASSSPEVKFGI